MKKTIHTLASTLRRDIYRIGEFGHPVAGVKPPSPDPLAAARYACVYWVGHLCDWLSQPPPKQRVDVDRVNRMVDEFMRKKYLYWLEALSLCGNVLQGVVLLGKLVPLIQVRSAGTYYQL